MKRRNVVLTGFMGTGKSTVGRLLAVCLDYEFVDTDELIVARDGRPIAEIFRESGEDVFRQWEARISQELGQAEGLVIATGGRLMLDETNAAALLQNGRAVCLTAEPETIIDRLAADERRPLLAVPDPADRIRQLLAAREAAYGRFPQITTEGRTPQQVAQEIKMLMDAEAGMQKDHL